MIAISHKTKQYLLVTAKVLIIGLTFGYIFYKISYTKSLGFSEFKATIAAQASVSGYLLLLFLVLAAANWYFEILKWQSLVSVIQKMNFQTAMKQSLASLTVSLATPNRIGEYGAKALFFENSKRKKVLLLNFFSSGSQMLVTTLFGILGLLYFLRNFNVAYSVKTLCYFGIGVILLFAIGYYFKEKELLMKGFSFSKVFQFFKQIPFRIKRNVLLFSMFRYIIFSGMFYGLLQFFGAEIAFFDAMLLIFTMYFLVSIVPTFFIFDVVIRGGVAVWLFSFVNVSEFAVLATVLTIWIFNFVLPALLGSFYVLTYQPTTR
ncbi:lysylphosphatidylglycerol synthase domain-containing protein [Aequorivita todarodis]|uniref:lysylphosphatidylglycerol synthase domain-containing protein n=1 Tax=Aequorivita todarodis TaxID=2036821 RepID=UPI00234FDC6C|nr:lysylphosphatidylglycerol synthase domain-containing protein [Aequorivita todarodis]MDC8001726.1 lysylphosphatidylglycerol synthase domain-containing protein [Aequorivita todarodis]